MNPIPKENTLSQTRIFTANPDLWGRIPTTLLLLWVGLSAGAVGCGGGGGGGGGGVAAGPIDYSRNRDAMGDITPILSEDGSGFDAAEVDSPAIVQDSGRPGADVWILYYEATSSGAVSTIGAITSDEEDFTTLTVNRTQVIGVGGGGSGYDVGATDPTVLVDKGIAFGVDGRYQMWFEGRSGAGGATSSIIHCTSADGISWSNFTICTGLTPSFGSVRVADPCVIRDDGLFKMWFEAIDVASGPGVIGYATSADGTSWTIRDASGNTGVAANPVFEPGASGFDAYSVNAPSVVRNPIVADGGANAFMMWYEAGDNASSTENTIGLATSTDGLTWSDPTSPVFDPSSDSIVPLPFDSGDVEHPSAFIDENLPSTTRGHYLLYYTGDGENGASPNRIGLAEGVDN